jgi:[ribosomal protein S18]-alanine N-acetyltransferase
MSLPTHLRSATAADLEAILTLERATLAAPHWPPATYAEIVATQNTNPQRCLFVAESESQITGFAAGLLNHTEATAELETVAVAATAQRTGIGRALSTAVLNWCREQGATSIALEVRATSIAAIALYTNLGFTLTGRRPNYYSDPKDDALILHLALP